MNRLSEDITRVIDYIKPFMSDVIANHYNITDVQDHDVIIQDWLDSCTFFSFQVVYGDTSLNGGGYGGQTMTTARSYAFIMNRNNVIIVDGVKVYHVWHASEKFFHDLLLCQKFNRHEAEYRRLK